MDTVVLSHALYKDGMEVLKDKVEIRITNNGDSDVIINDLKNADGLILRIGKIDRKAIEACNKLRVITRPGVGYDNVDIKAATENGIPVVICPATNARAVAEHAMALIFGLSKNLVESHQETRKGNFNIRNKYVAVELSGKTVSIIGFGNIGKVLASLCTGVGMKVCAYDPFVSQETVEGMGYGYAASLNDALAKGDFVSLHMPSLPETRDLVSREQLEVMKPTAFLINCARGEIVNENDLYDAIVNHTIAGAALDVMRDEPMKKENQLMRLENVIITPHMAAQTQETTSKIVTMAAEGTLAVLKGIKWPHVANPDVYDHPKWKL